MAEVISFRPGRSGLPKRLRWLFPAVRRYRWVLVAIAVLAAAGFAIGQWQTGFASRIVTTRLVASKLAGFATVVDGDTIRIRGERIRFIGMDAPELRQTCRDAFGRDWLCGRAARERLAALVAGSPVTCSPRGHDRYRRVLAVCTSSAGDDLGGTLVREGLAVAYGDYRLAEASARLGAQGLWKGEFERPPEWRKAHQR
jgi:endonuclease YncB( thermonuclease family)